MRLHPLAAACLAALLCVALTSCSQQEEDADDTPEPPVGAALDPDTGEADESSPPPERPEEEWPFGTPVGWADQPMALAGPVDEDEADGDSGDDAEASADEEDPDSEEAEDPAEDAPAEHPGVTGGADGETVTATDADQLAEYLGAEEPLVVEVEGGIDLDGTVRVASDKTLLGVGEGAEFTGGGLAVDGADNVILANLGMVSAGPAVTIRGGAHHVWVDGSTFSGGEDDSLISVTDGADHVTLSWNHFTEAESAVTVGVGDDEPGALRVTVHHNFFDGTSERHPRARNAEHVHVFNNYFRANPEYGVQSSHGSQVLVEGNYFENTPVSVSTEPDEPGNVVTRDNLLVDSDQPEPRGTVPDPPYAYELDDTVNVPELVMSRAGID
ncbi:right-handed parallel beta-helix repeat-containing protein [Nocardiopsis sp. B62]|uniref:pectate lyase family protein n=1 Tax=Nocardiopsis sp. B62 TaxID=2824874 RepID=UPI001B369386|nr:right-handed parallel beta-helix repeat-containing protein [Nocardiopsis sp. B62]MBQ1082644.1 right-handed parallel beta-helix repeat-containing protein [Nocardiopsis sp. B62]